MPSSPFFWFSSLLFEAEETWRWRGSENRPQSRFRIVRFFRRVVGGVLAIFTLRRSSGRHTSKSDPAPMASEDVARRLGMADDGGPVHIAPQRIVVSGPRRVEAAPPPVPLVVPPLAAERSSRLRLLRDTVGATLVLIGFVVVAINVVIPPQSPNPLPSGGVLAATSDSPRSMTPTPTEAPCRVRGRDRVDRSGAVADPDDPRLVDSEPDADPDRQADDEEAPDSGATCDGGTDRPTDTQADTEADAQADAEADACRPFR